MTERNLNVAFETLVKQIEGDDQVAELVEIADSLGMEAIIAGPVEKLPYVALSLDTMIQTRADLVAERTRRQKSVQRTLAEASLWYIAV